MNIFDIFEENKKRILNHMKRTGKVDLSPVKRGNLLNNWNKEKLNDSNFKLGKEDVTRRDDKFEF